ncbi:hypothetical protein [Cyclobacterium lianum]|uniref:hypothetical protein n=1 Tax=Cyclobacterium lianum TaxID=388280 RepID=UPI0015B3E334|nr:hypothetical protein [Cyclobacterium lianum]
MKLIFPYIALSKVPGKSSGQPFRDGYLPARCGPNIQDPLRRFQTLYQPDFTYLA